MSLKQQPIVVVFRSNDEFGAGTALTTADECSAADAAVQIPATVQGAIHVPAHERHNGFGLFVVYQGVFVDACRPLFLCNTTSIKQFHIISKRLRQKMQRLAIFIVLREKY